MCSELAIPVVSLQCWEQDLYSRSMHCDIDQLVVKKLRHWNESPLNGIRKQKYIELFIVLTLSWVLFGLHFVLLKVRVFRLMG